MNLFNVYPIYDIEPVKAEGEFLWDSKGDKYVDLYGGHAVISIGHSHPHYVSLLSDQLSKIGFYSNSVIISQQKELASKLGELSGYDDYSLFLCNSGAEAIENALKLASFHNGRKKVVAFHKAFHGRTSAAVAVTENFAIQAPINKTENVVFLALNDSDALDDYLSKNEVCAVIIEGIQGVGGVNMPTDDFLKKVRGLCNKYNCLLILDEIQSGYGRTGKFFAHQYADIKADIIAMAKGMGNGFPIGGILISPEFKASYGLLGTTFGGNHLACVAGIAVLDVIKSENLLNNAIELGNYLMDEVKKINGVKEVRGRGLMIGIDFDFQIESLRKHLLFEHKFFTGNASSKTTLRILPCLNVNKSTIDSFLVALKQSVPNFLTK